MTTEKQIEVMQAFVDGKQIQFKDESCSDWIDLDSSPSWNWSYREYRIKPELKYVPYKDTEEMIEDYCNRFDIKCKDYEIPVIWLINACEKKMIIAFRDGSVKMLNGMNGIEFWNMNDIFNECSYLDGSIIGKLVEE